jgi:hypothetical protein
MSNQVMAAAVSNPTTANDPAPAPAPATTAAAATEGNPAKKLRATADILAPTVATYKSIWVEALSEDTLMTINSIFGTDRSWFVRDSYIHLYNDIMNDSEYHPQIVNGTAGIGKSSFLLYTLARVRCTGKCALLHFQRSLKETAALVFFPADGGAPISKFANEPDFHPKLSEWYRLVGAAGSVFLSDGVVTFSYDDVQGVKYITTKSASCDIGWMGHDQNRFDRWLVGWAQAELVSYATQVGITDANTIIEDNMFHIGGVCRYALKKNAARNAVMNAIFEVGAKAAKDCGQAHHTFTTTWSDRRLWYYVQFRLGICRLESCHSIMSGD